MPKILPTLLIYIIVVVSFFFLSPSVANAQVVINEVLPNPAGNDEGTEWVELYNLGSISVDIAGYKLKDEAGHEQIITTGSISAGGWLQIYAEGSFSLNNTGSETLFLYDSTSQDPLNTFPYNGSTENKSWGRVPDGDNISTQLLEPTGGYANLVSTPIPTFTPTSTPTATPTPTPTPTKTPTPTPTKKPTPKPSPKEEIVLESQTSNSDQVLGLREQLKTLEPEGGEESPKKKFPVLPVILIIFGAGLMGFAGYTLFKKMKTEGYNNQSEENN